MINLEIFRLELNYLRQVTGSLLGNDASIDISMSIELLVIHFLNPSLHTSSSLSHLQNIEQNFNKLNQNLKPYEYQILLNNIPNIRNLIKKIKTETSKSL